MKKRSKPDAAECCERAQVFYERGDLKYAVAYLMKALKLDPKSAAAHHRLAVALQDSDRRESISHYKRALELDRLGVNAVGRRAEADRLKITLAISTLEQQLQNGSCMWVAM